MRDLPPPVTRKSSKEDLWAELCAARSEIDQIHQGLQAAMAALDKERAESAATRKSLNNAYMRLGVIQAALAHPNPDN